MKDKKVIIILIVGALLIFTGIIIISVTTILKEKEDKPNAQYNESEKLKEKHCLESMCIDTLTILKDNETGVNAVKAILKNKSGTPISEGFFKIELSKDKVVESKLLFHGEIPANGEIELEWQHSNEQLLEAIDYKLIKPTPEELKEATSQIDKEKAE